MARQSLRQCDSIQIQFVYAGTEKMSFMQFDPLFQQNGAIMPELISKTLCSEYDSLVLDLADDVTTEQIVAALIARHDWTEDGARAIVTLARTYGTAILRNATALAAAMNIEDGSSLL